MSDIDRRIVRVSIEIDGQLKIYEDLDIHVTGQKLANTIENTCEVKISNLSKATRNYLLTETSPFNKNKTKKRLIVEAGRVSTGVTRVYLGDIISSSPSQPPDIGLTLKAQTGAFYKSKLVATTGKEIQSISELAQLCANDTETTLEFSATDRSISTYSFTGSALTQLNKIEQFGGIDAFLDDDIMVVKDRNKPRTSRVRVLRKDTGMIGIPEVTERGVKVKFLFDSETALGGQLSIESELNPALNGDYLIYKLGFELATRDVPFYWAAEATRL